MGLSSQPEQVLDQRFFHMTGLAMVLGTLVAGAITVWLATDTGMAPTGITRNIGKGNPTERSQKHQIFVVPVSEVNFRVRSNEMVFNSR
jgi:hypothetical protein